MVLLLFLLRLPVVIVACGLALSALPFFSSSFALVVVRFLGTATCSWRQSSAEGFMYGTRCVSVGVFGALSDQPAGLVAGPVIVGRHLDTMMGRKARSFAGWFSTPLDPNIKVGGA